MLKNKAWGKQERRLHKEIAKRTSLLCKERHKTTKWRYIALLIHLQGRHSDGKEIFRLMGSNGKSK